MFHYREARGPEIDLLVEQGQTLAAIEIKSGATISGDFFKNLPRFSKRMDKANGIHTVDPYLIYGGDVSQNRSSAQVLPWQSVHRIIEC
jgi:hypothetical protein